MVERRQAMPGANCIECPMRQHNEWRVLTGAEVRLLAQARKCRRYRAGETVFTAGEPSYGIYCIVDGATAMRQIDAEGNTVLIQISYPGDTLGYRGLLIGGKTPFQRRGAGTQPDLFHRSAGGQDADGAQSSAGPAIPAAHQYGSG